MAGAILGAFLAGATFGAWVCNRVNADAAKARLIVIGDTAYRLVPLEAPPERSGCVRQ